MDVANTHGNARTAHSRCNVAHNRSRRGAGVGRLGRPILRASFPVGQVGSILDAVWICRLTFPVNHRSRTSTTAERAGASHAAGDPNAVPGVNPAPPDGAFLLRTRQLTPQAMQEGWGDGEGDPAGSHRSGAVRFVVSAPVQRAPGPRRPVAPRPASRSRCPGCVSARGTVQVGADVEPANLETARRDEVDLILLGTDLRPASGRLFLGPRVERLLRSAPCPVIVVNWTSTTVRNRA